MPVLKTNEQAYKDRQLEPNYQLKPYQQILIDKRHMVKHILLADEMGLGKTVEAIAMDREKRIRYGYSDSKTLVIAPLSVVDVWKTHYGWMLPNMRVTAYDPTGVQPLQARRAFLEALNQKRSDVYIIHWDALRKLKLELKAFEWFHVIADEVHRAKNRKAQQTQALKTIKPEHKTGCTGTPAETRPHDLWSILHWLYPNKFTSYWRFYNSFVAWNQTPQGYKVVTGVRNVRQLHEEIKNFYVRRRKDQVLKDLPEKTYTTIEVNLTPRQRTRYQQMKKDMLTWVGEHDEEPLAAPAIIARLMRLQQFAISDCEIVEGVKWVLVEDERAAAATNRSFTPKTLFDSRDPITVRRSQETAKKHKTPAGEIQVTEVFVGDRIKTPVKVVRMIDPSPKLDAVMQMIEDNPNESFVVFSQFKQVINLLGTRLRKADVGYGIYTGDTDKVIRDAIVRDFQLKKIRVFAGTIRAGGEGITLTASSTVVFVDRDWSPSKNKQAEDRLHRVGQKNAVQVIDIVAKGTIDRGRLQQIAQSWEWIKKLLGDGE
jgi:SNF2 family DNA or RNA helicase